MKNSTSFRISGLPIDSFLPYFKMTEEQLAQHKACRVIADSKPGFPCRVSLIEAEPGETLILLPYIHHGIAGPYQSSGPIYVRENAKSVELQNNELPEVAKTRLMSIRAYSAEGWMQASGVAEGEAVRDMIEYLFSDAKVSYLHMHNAKPGCYSCRVDRV